MNDFDPSAYVMDPVEFVRMCWPDVYLYDKQREIMYSVRDNDETFVPAGNQLGKDFISALVSLWFICTRRPGRAVTTSVKADQLNDVLWGEIRRFINTSKYRLPIQYNHMHIRQVYNDGSFVPLSELVGQVIKQGEALLGRHLPFDIPRTLAVFDESSGIDTEVYTSSDTWARRKLVIGNPFPCDNFFKWAVKGRPGSEDRGGNILAPDGKRFYRKVIKIKATDSPNVRFALAQIANGKEPDNRILVPGLKSWDLYQKHLSTWDKVMQCIGLEAEFYEGEEVLLFPPEWLNRAERIARDIAGMKRTAKAIGIDPAEGGDCTVMTAIDERGIIDQTSVKTPDTSVIPNRALAFARDHDCPPEQIVFDAGGGGKQHADRLRYQGYNVRLVYFGDSPSSVDRFKHFRTKKERKAENEVKMVYKNRRAEMYGIARRLLDPSNGFEFGIPEKLVELRRQLSPLPLLYDGEGKLYLPPKNKRNPNSTEKTLTEILGRSPDEADSFVLAVYGMVHKTSTITAGTI